MIYITTFFDILFKFWWIFPVLAFLVYGFYFLKTSKQEKKRNKLRKIENPNVEVLSEEEKYLNISLTQKSIDEFMPRIETLVKKLVESKDVFTVTAIEAIFVAEKIADSLKLNEDGILVIEHKKAKDLSISILKNPMEIIHYIKAVEKKIDVNNKKNKIPLDEVLYMMRNAKRFGLYKERDGEEFEMMFKLKTAIHDSYYSDIPVKIVDEIKEDSLQNNSEDFFIYNTHKFDEKEEQPDTQLDPDTGLIIDSNILKVEKLDGDKIRIYTKNQKIIEKSDLKTYNFRDLVEEEEERIAKEKKLGIYNNSNNGNSNLPKRIEDNPLEYDSEKNSPDNLADEVKNYIKRFGELDSFEKDINNQANLNFKYRSRFFYDKSNTRKISFLDSEVLKGKLFENKKVFYKLLSQLFNQENALLETKKDILLPCIFIGKKELKNKKVFNFMSISVDFILSILYMMIKKDDRENFYQFVYKDWGKINIENLEII